MKCFYHHDLDAVGVCKSCGRGLCPGCAVEIPQGIACRSRCEEDAEKLSRMIQKSVDKFPETDRLVNARRSGGVLAAGFYLVQGAMFILWGRHERFSFLIAIGAALALFGIILLIRTLRLTQKRDE